MYGLNILRGELLLDREYPEWLSAIDLDRLNLGSTRSCVLGQIEEHATGEDWHGLYTSALERFDLDPEANEHNDANPNRLGFDAYAPSEAWVRRTGDDDGGDYVTLTQEWLAAIADRCVPASPDPVAYAYDAALHHADCILVKLGALTREENAARQFPVEHALDRLAEDYGVNRTGEFDLNDFPVPIAEDDAALVTEDGRPESCDTCLQVIEP